MDPVFETLRSIVSTRTRRIVVWCGAGLSASVGIPAWKPLQRLLETALVKKLETLDISEAQKEAKIRSIRQELNPWVAFHRLQNDLGLASYRETIRASLSRAVTVDVPDVYKKLWALKPSGLINLNLDRLATRALIEVGKPTNPIEFKGKEIGAYTHTLESPRPFICNIHGVEEDVDSWVFTQPALKDLMGSEAYRNYISAILTTCTVIFVGLTVDDVAVGGHLERLVKDGIVPKNHYWITDRRDQATDAWAEKNSVRVLRYKSSDGTHSELLDILEQLSSYVQPDDEAPPPIAFDLGLADPGLEPQFALVSKSPEEIRSSLNAHAAAILAKGDEQAFQEYEEFSKSYDRSIHMAWYTSTDRESGDNIFLGYALEHEIARGAFGIVFKAVDDDGNYVAIKVLHAEIRKQQELLKAFRRGARSMRIISEHDVQGMVKYIGASEIPATLIMDWVDGPNLNQVVEAGLDEWEVIINLSLQLAEVIAAAHALPERVLHRDIRPSNMIVMNYWEGGELELRVIDFDLSWHRGSVEKSVIFGSQLSGFLAPEQLRRIPGVSTQHASVDAYGIGMTIFFMVSGRGPSPGEHAHATWGDTLASASRRPRGSSWKSVAARSARLIFNATKEKQPERWDVIQIRSELMRLQKAVNNPSLVESAELWAEELATQSTVVNGYVWNDDKLAAVCDFGTGLVVEIAGDELAQEVVCKFYRTAGEADNRVKLGETITRARDSVYAILNAGGWSVRAIVGHGFLEVTGRIDVAVLKASLGKSRDSLDRAIEKMIFA